MEPDKHYPGQMNGPVLSAFGQGVSEEFENAEAVVKYLHDLTIDTAQETELENIGRLIGYPRPLVPDGFENENIFLFGTEPLARDPLVGFGSVEDQIGGQLSTLQNTQGNLMPLGNYRQLLRQVAYVKRYGLTLAVVDKIAASIANDYTITYNEAHDLVVTYERQIGYKNVYILTQLFYRLATEPQVIIVSGIEEEEA